MLLCLDVGNTHILGGVFDGEQLVARFRYATHLIGTADQFGIFLVNILLIIHFFVFYYCFLPFCLYIFSFDVSITITSLSCRIT